MIKRGVFISFCWDNRDLTSRVHDAIKKTRYLYPIVITNPERANAQLWSPEKVALGIIECSFFIPIISELSLNNQWVNQEIGYAAASGRPIYPIVQQVLVDEKKLKGWVNTERDQPYRFDLHEDPKAARRLFRNAYNPILEHLDQLASTLTLASLTNQDKLKLKKGILVIHGNGRSSSAYLKLDDYAYPIADKKVFNALKGMISNRKVEQLAREVIDRMKQGQLIKQ